MAYKVNDKIHINHINDPYANYDGREGYIVYIDDMKQLHGTWGSLAVLPEEDDIELIYEYTPLYYLTPCQVKWYNYITGKMDGGIAFEDKIIKTDGSIELLDQIVTDAVIKGIAVDDAIIELEWLDLII